MKSYDNGLELKVYTSQELHDLKQVDSSELHGPIFKDRTVFIFDNPQKGHLAMTAFVQQYLIPKYGVDTALKFPLTRTGPSQDSAAPLLEAIGAYVPKPTAIWFTVPNDRFEEMENFFKEFYLQTDFKHEKN